MEVVKQKSQKHLLAIIIGVSSRLLVCPLRVGFQL